MRLKFNGIGVNLEERFVRVLLEFCQRDIKGKNLDQKDSKVKSNQEKKTAVLIKNPRKRLEKR